MEQYTAATTFLDYNSPEIQGLIAEFKSDSLSLKEKAIGVYTKIRDGYRYNAYNITLNKDKFKASYLAKQKEGHCVDKAILLTAALRGLNIPARIRLAKVTNHIAVERLTNRFGTNILTPHGMVEVYLDGWWIKATPAFNKELCILCKVAPLEFDGKTDSMFQEYNTDGQQFMEYLEDYGSFEDVPVDFMMKNLLEHYPGVFDPKNGNVDYKF
ncbi:MULTISPECIES: transglutaminase family protein [Flavobacteriaceae]|uniref:transglutaminase-like domain-containing protein n=1 Tax=Flavobacteriaceae TaxID=49546 RepID=UPI0010AEAC49|nr:MULTISPECIES: transglutaminase family protein [Flavobacteriaceae]NJB35633.1 transglutaminase family protein [Croceivirga sp. JEA036]TKD66067.1 transglutaminase family protein [Flavobacterium sp. ASW18X]